MRQLDDLSVVKAKIDETVLGQTEDGIVTC